MSLVDSEKLPHKWEPPEFSLKNTDGQTVSLSDLADKKGVLVVFTCNHCPYAKAAWPLLIDLYKQFGDEIGFVAINSNDGEMYPEDSFKEMKKEVEKRKIEFAYLHDETQEIAQKFKAQCTPDPYLFKNKDRKLMLYYHGRINDNWQNSDQVTQENLKEALGGVTKDQAPPDNQPASMGCSIKWK